MSTKDDALIEAMINAASSANPHFDRSSYSGMRAALAVARKAILEEAASVIDSQERELSSYLERGKGLHGTPGYITDDTWSSWLGQRMICEALARKIRSLNEASHD